MSQREHLATLGRFKEIAINKYGVTLIDDYLVDIDGGAETQIWYLTRLRTDNVLGIAQTRLLSVQVPEVEDDEPLSAMTISRLCRKLELPRYPFGLFP